ncbi:hypothetical protein [Salinisphaera sp. T31B1]|uniref:hypothetical protein n=1 Tax=Salinisphaera sp. T31B1 TaxID=727963 RepID=UPI00333E4D7D
MSRDRIALALTTTVDIEAVRRLHDYGDLDDAGVVRAFEQTRMQRYGHLVLPGYLRRLDGLTCIVDRGGDIHMLDIADDVDEGRMLDTLDRALDGRAADTLVWQHDELGLLTTRALLNRRVLAPALCDGHPIALADTLFDGDDDEAAAAEAAMMTVYGLQPDRGTTAIRAANRYRLWLGREYSLGRISGADHDTRIEALAAAVQAVAGR